MYEVTYSVDGIVRKLEIPAQDSVTATEIVTNMFGRGKVQIIGWRRI